MVTADVNKSQILLVNKCEIQSL